MLSIRLKRMGRKHRPYYRLVVSDSRNRTTGSNVDEVGHYDPLPNPSKITIDMEKVDYWMSKGAKPSGTVAKLIAITRKGAQA